MSYAAREMHLVVEGGGAVTLAAILNGAWTPHRAEAPVAVVISGGNVSADRLREVTEPAG